MTSSMVAPGVRIRCTVASITSPRLCGGMLVAMPTAMPFVPLTSRFGTRAGRTVGSLQAVVEVRREIDALLVDVGEELHRELREPRFGVPVRGRRVAVDGAVVALAVDERVAHRKVLGEADHRVVDRLVAVRVVLAEHVADDGGALAVPGRRAGAPARTR